LVVRRQLPGNQWFLWLRSDCIRAGVLTGIYISCTFAAWLLVANRIPQLAQFAGFRNFAAGSVTIMLAAIPIVRYRSRPVKLFFSGLTAWAVLTLTYIAMEMHFALLNSRMGPFNLFMLGAVSYGFAAVFQWVFLLCSQARQKHQDEAAHSMPHVSRRHTH
jgi:hypothetical protein